MIGSVLKSSGFIYIFEYINIYLYFPFVVVMECGRWIVMDSYFM